MLRAYVGVASSQGLALLQPECDDTLSLVRRSVQGNIRRVGFWAVLGDTDARCVQALFLGGLCREAMMLLDRSAKDMGCIMPSDASPPRLH